MNKNFIVYLKQLITILQLITIIECLSIIKSITNPIITYSHNYRISITKNINQLNNVLSFHNDNHIYNDINNEYIITNNDLNLTILSYNNKDINNNDYNYVFECIGNCELLTMLPIIDLVILMEDENNNYIISDSTRNKSINNTIISNNTINSTDNKLIKPLKVILKINNNVNPQQINIQTIIMKELISINKLSNKKDNNDLYIYQPTINEYIHELSKQEECVDWITIGNNNLCSLPRSIIHRYNLIHKVYIIHY